MQDKEFDSIFKNRLNNLPIPPAPSMGWKELDSQLNRNDLRIRRYHSIGIGTIAVLLLVSNLFWWYHFEQLKNTLPDLSNKPTSITTTTQLPIVAKNNEQGRGDILPTTPLTQNTTEIENRFEQNNSNNNPTNNAIYHAQPTNLVPNMENIHPLHNTNSQSLAVPQAQFTPKAHITIKKGDKTAQNTFPKAPIQPTFKELSAPPSTTNLFEAPQQNLNTNTSRTTHQKTTFAPTITEPIITQPQNSLEEIPLIISKKQPTTSIQTPTNISSHNEIQATQPITTDDQQPQNKPSTTIENIDNANNRQAIESENKTNVEKNNYETATMQPIAQTLSKPKVERFHKSFVKEAYLSVLGGIDKPNNFRQTNNPYLALQGYIGLHRRWGIWIEAGATQSSLSDTQIEHLASIKIPTPILSDHDTTILQSWSLKRFNSLKYRLGARYNIIQIPQKTTLYISTGLEANTFFANNITFDYLTTHYSHHDDDDDNNNSGGSSGGGSGGGGGGSGGGGGGSGGGGGPGGGGGSGGGNGPNGDDDDDNHQTPSKINETLTYAMPQKNFQLQGGILGIGIQQKIYKKLYMQAEISIMMPFNNQLYNFVGNIYGAKTGLAYKF